MLRPKHKKLLPRVKLLLILMVGAILFEFLLIKPGEAVMAWSLLIALVIVGGVFFVIPLDLTIQEPLTNRWYRAAHWAGWILCMLLGVLFLGAAVVWGIGGLKAYSETKRILSRSHCWKQRSAQARWRNAS
jgi:hypothetical protein